MHGDASHGGERFEARARHVARHARVTGQITPATLDVLELAELDERHVATGSKDARSEDDSPVGTVDAAVVHDHFAITQRLARLPELAQDGALFARSQRMARME